jgi:hypothetical protein
MSAYSTLKAACANHRGCKAESCQPPTDQQRITQSLTDAGQAYFLSDRLTIWVEGGIELWFNVDGKLISIVRG